MASATTVGELIDQTKRVLYGMTRGIQNQLLTTINSSVTSLTFTYDPGASVAPGTYLCIDDEIIYCWTVPASNAVTVQRAQLGTTAASHTAGALIEVSPRFPRPVIRDALQEELASWPSEVYGTVGVNLSVAANTLSVDLTGIPTSYYKILQVLRKPTTATSSSVWDPLSTNWRNVGFRPERNLDTAEFASGSAIFLNDTLSSAYTLRVVYGRPFDLSGFATDATSLTSSVLLESTMIDIPPQGAAWRLLSRQEIFRTALEAQGESRNTADVPVGQTIRAAAAFEQYRNTRLAEEAIRLANRHPWRITT